MASFFNLFLDTTAPQNFSFLINDGAMYTQKVGVTLAFSTDDTDTTGYQVKIWGINGVDTEETATWESWAATKNVDLTSEEGLKTVYAKVRDSVYNESATVSKTITLDTTVPVVTITGPDVARISKKEGKNVSAFSFMADVKIMEWKVMVVQDSSALVDTETNVLIPVDGGSTNMSGTTETAANTAVACAIRGEDLNTASSGDGTKIIKVFVRSETGAWSVA